MGICNSFIILNFESNGLTHLMKAVNRDDQQIVNLLVLMGADVNLINEVWGFCNLLTTIARKNCANDSQTLRQPVSDWSFESYAK